MARRSVGYWWLKKDLTAAPVAVKSHQLRVEKWTMHIPWFSKMRHLEMSLCQFKGDLTFWVECRGRVRCVGTRGECIAVIRAHHVDWLAEVLEW